MSTIKKEMQDFEGIVVSASAYLTVHLTEFRNGSDDMGIVQTMARRVVGELGYAALALASLVETVFRVGLSIILIPPACLFCDTDPAEFVAGLTLFGALVSAENTLNSIAALVQNIYTQKIDYDEIIPCITAWNNEVMK